MGIPSIKEGAVDIVYQYLLTNKISIKLFKTNSSFASKVGKSNYRANKIIKMLEDDQVNDQIEKSIKDYIYSKIN